MMRNYSGLNLNQDKATKPQTVQIVRQGEATPYWFKFNPLYLKATPKQLVSSRMNWKKFSYPSQCKRSSETLNLVFRRPFKAYPNRAA